MTRIILAFLGLAMLAAANLSGADAKTSGKRVSITGEIPDTVLLLAYLNRVSISFAKGLPTVDSIWR